MQLRRLKPGDTFMVPMDRSHSLYRKQWSIDVDGIGYNAALLGGSLEPVDPMWIDEDVEVVRVGEKEWMEK